MNLYLTAEELKLVSDPEVLLTKNKIISRVYELFGCLAEEYKSSVLNELKAISANAKISKGENYLGLPYVMLDYPKVFMKADVFAVRSFFWWGNFFSITLHISGRYLEEYLPNLLQNYSLLRDWSVCVAEYQWMHHFEESNYQSIGSFPEQTLGAKGFIKLAKKIPLWEWDNSFSFFTEHYKQLMEMLSTNTVK